MSMFIRSGLGGGSNLAVRSRALCTEASYKVLPEERNMRTWVMDPSGAIRMLTRVES